MYGSGNRRLVTQEGTPSSRGGQQSLDFKSRRPGAIADMSYNHNHQHKDSIKDSLDDLNAEDVRFPPVHHQNN